MAERGSPFVRSLGRLTVTGPGLELTAEGRGKGLYWIWGPPSPVSSMSANLAKMR